MANISDIPVRKGLDGATQLAYLRSYLKDRDVTNYKYSDQLLIYMLVEDDRVTVWRTLTGNLKGIPWGYSVTANMSPESRIRILTGDTEEGSLRYTDYDLKVFLDIMPLRYVISLINIEAQDVNTFPTDTNHPIHIVRFYLGDTDILSPKYTDTQIVRMLYNNREDPYTLVTRIVAMTLGGDSSENVMSGGSGDIASLDGISFSNEESKSKSLSYDVDYIQKQRNSSPYHKEIVYDYWLNKKSYTTVEWEADWYRLPDDVGSYLKELSESDILQLVRSQKVAIHSLEQELGEVSSNQFYIANIIQERL